ncbi:MAG TPA: hypothetical protein VIL29_06355 [Pseudothermotoga sp.]
MKGSLLTEAIISLLLVSILLVFGFESITLSLAQTNKIEAQIEVTSLLNFVYGYLSKYEMRHDVSNITAASINNLYWNGNIQYPRVSSLSFQDVSKTISSNQIKYRKAYVVLEQKPGKTTEFVFIFGL